MISEHHKITQLTNKKQWNEVSKKDIRINIQNNNPPILYVSSRDLLKPFKGDTRLILSSLGALSLKGYKTIHLYLAPKKPREPYTITATDGEVKASINVIEIPFGEESYQNSWFNSNKLLNDIINQLPEKPNTIICERRPLFMLCSKLSKYLKVPWILRIDALKFFWALKRAQYTRNIIPLLKAPFVIASYVLMAKYADYGICVTKLLEKKLRRLMVKNITTVEPTYLTISDMDKYIPDDFDLNKIDEDYVIISTKDYKVIKLVALKASNFKYIIIGSPPQRMTERLPKNIVWTGTIPDQKLIQLYKNALCTIIYRPWLSGVSMTFVETLRYGRPCIINSAAINLTNGYENIEGFLVTDDVSVWPTLLEKLQANKSFKLQLEIAARKFFDENFSPEIHTVKMKHVIDITNKLGSSPN